MVFARVHEGLDVLFIQEQSGRAAVQHRAQRRSMAFPPSREPKHAAECVDAHAAIHVPTVGRCPEWVALGWTKRGFARKNKP